LTNNGNIFAMILIINIWNSHHQHAAQLFQASFYNRPSEF